MSWILSRQNIDAEKQGLVSFADLSKNAKSILTKVAARINDSNISFLVISIGMIVMLFWAGLFKLTPSGAAAITPWVAHDPLISWQFIVFGPHIGSDIIGLTEITASLLFIVGYFKAEAGIVAGLITTLMFFITSTMFITTPGTIASIQGMKYMSFLGLFFFKDVIALGASLYLVGFFGRKAVLSESRSK